MFAKFAVCAAFLFTIFPGAAPADELNPVLGKTGDFILRAVDLERLVSMQPAEIQKKLQDDPEQRVSLVRQLLTQKAVVSRARKEGFDKKPDVREQLAHVIDDFIAREYLFKVVAASVTVSEEDLKKYYKDNESKFLIPEQIKPRHIFVEAARELKTEERGKALAKAEALLQRLKKGEEFAKLAQQASEDSDSAKQGGELGTVSPGATSSEEFEKAAFALKAGEISDIVTTPYGYHIIKVDQRTEKRSATFEEAREYIRKNLQNDHEARKVQEFMEQASKEAGIEVFADRITGKKEGEHGHDKQK